MEKRSGGASLAERAFVLVANHLCSPGSEHHLASWLETAYVCDRHGRVPVNPSAEGLQRWYRTLDKLLERKEAIEQALYLKLRDLFSLKTELVFIGGKLKALEKIGAAAAQILVRNHGHRYYGWEMKEDAFHYFEHPNLEREKAYEGKYLIQTEEQNLSPVDAVAADKELSEVERAFRCLKDVINTN